MSTTFDLDHQHGERTSDVWVHCKVTEPSIHLGLTIPIGNVSGTPDNPRPVTTPSRSPPPAPPPPPQPVITYDVGFPSLPDDIINEVFSLLDPKTLKSCSLTGKALSYLAKPFIHRTLRLTPWSRTEPNDSGYRNEFDGLPTLGERSLLKHTRHISVIPRSGTLFAGSLDPHIQHLHTLTNLRILHARWLDTPSFNPKMEKYFGAFLGTLQSLELEFPRGDHKQIFYFICQFPNLRNLKINSVRGPTQPMSNDAPRSDIKTSPPLDGTLDLQWNMGTENDPMGAHSIPSDLASLPSGLRFRTLKLSGYTSDNIQLLIDACAPTLECVEFTGASYGVLFPHRGERPLFTFVRTIQLSGFPRYPQLNFERHPALRKLEIALTQHANAEYAVRWLPELLSTITSNVFTKLTVYLPPFPAPREDQVRPWSPVDDVLDRFSRRADATLVVIPYYPAGGEFEGSIRTCFPSMWKDRKVVVKPPPPYVEDQLLVID